MVVDPDTGNVEKAKCFDTYKSSKELESFISAELNKQGYSQVYTPHVGKLDLFRTSGHFPYYQDSQYPPIIHRECLTKLAEEGCSCSELSNKLDEGEIEG